MNNPDPSEPLAFAAHGLDVREFSGAIPAAHQQAMAVAEEARAALKLGHTAAASVAFKRAAGLERDAVRLLLQSGNTGARLALIAESGSRLAMRAFDLPLATELARLGLRGNPPSDLAWQLRLLTLATTTMRAIEPQALWTVEDSGLESAGVDLVLQRGAGRVLIVVDERNNGPKIEDDGEQLTLRMSLKTTYREITDAVAAMLPLSTDLPSVQTSGSIETFDTFDRVAA